MWPTEINQDIITRLQQDYGLKGRGDYLRGGKCPECGKKELFIKREEPHHLKCGRTDKCGWGSNTRDLYPDLFKPLHERYPPTPQDPKATAKAYLRERGLDARLFDAEFTQGQRYEREALREPKGTETVKFRLTDGVTWERFITVIDMPDKPKKAHFMGSYKGLWWQPSAFNPERGDQVFMVEGILDALSLIQSGFMAVSLMSCNNWPEQSLETYRGQNIRWVLALDNDKAGKRYNREFCRKLENLGEKVEVCTAPDQDKRDFNDLLKDCHGKIRTHDLEEWFYAGRLLTATSAQQKALEIVNHTHQHYFTFDFADQLYVAKYSEKEGEDPLNIQNIATCKPEFLYFQRDRITETGRYYIRVTRPGYKGNYQGAFASSAITSEKAFKQRLMDLGAGLMFTGTLKQLENYQKTHWFPNGNRPEVDSINFVGYSKELAGWVFPKQAVFNGKLYQVNKDDYFELPDNQRVKTSFAIDKITVGDPELSHNEQLWLPDFKTAYGVKGLTALAFWVGSYFVEQIREEQDSFPWLELSGDPGTGKSMLLSFLWRLNGRPGYEGTNLQKASAATRRRTLEQYAGLPVVAIEGDHDNTSFLETMKPTYNGKGINARSVVNNGNETIEMPFRCSLIVAQNAAIDEERAVMERIVQNHWDKSHHTREGYAASNRLRSLESNDINGFMAACITREKTFMAKYRDHCRFMLKQLEANENLINQRLRHNHAQIMAIAHAIKTTGILQGLTTEDLKQLDTYLMTCCEERHNRLEADSPLVSEFWDIYHHLTDYHNIQVNHTSDSSRIAISMEHFKQIAVAEGLWSGLDMVQLKKELKASKRHPFIKYASVSSTLKKEKRSTKCFVFQNTEAHTRHQVMNAAA